MKHQNAPDSMAPMPTFFGLRLVTLGNPVLVFAVLVVATLATLVDEIPEVASERSSIPEVLASQLTSG